MKKNIYIVTMLLALTLTGCGPAAQADNNAKEIDNLKVEVTELKEDNTELNTEKEELLKENTELKAEIESMTNDTADEELVVETEETAANAGVISDFEIIDNGDDGLLVKYNYDVSAHEQNIDYASEVGADYYCMKYDFSNQVADVNNDGKDEVLINMYYANNVADGVCTSVVYAADNEGKLYKELSLNDFSLPANWFVYSDTTISEDGITVTGLWKNDSTFEMECDEAHITYDDGEWILNN